MAEIVLAIFLLTTLGSLAGLIGGILFLYNQTLGKVLSGAAIPFAAGVLLAVTFLDLLPEALEGIGPQVFTIVLIVLVSAFLFEEIVVHLHHHQTGGELENSLPLVVIGDTIHNFMDGVVIAASYLFNPSLGLLVALATFLHEVPHEIGDFGLMIQGGWSKVRVIAVNLLSACATYLGAIAVLLFSANIKDNLSSVLAVSGGLFLYIALTDLLPRVQESKSNTFRKAAFVIFGIALMWLVERVG